MQNKIEHTLNENLRLGKKLLAVLIDPDSTNQELLEKTCKHCNQAGVNLILVGGSLITNGFWDNCIETIKNLTNIPVLLFPGNILQVHPKADAILFLSMISGRNAELLIGKQVLAAPGLKKSGIEVIPTGYMIIDGGNITSVMYMSNTTPIPHNKSNIASCTAMAGEMMGLRTIYMDAGSGAKNPISAKMITEVREVVSTPIFVGGGIKTAQQAILAWNAGASVVVVGNAIEENPQLIYNLMDACNSYKTAQH